MHSDSLTVHSGHRSVTLSWKDPVIWSDPFGESDRQFRSGHVYAADPFYVFEADSDHQPVAVPESGSRSVAVSESGQDHQSAAVSESVFQFAVLSESGSLFAALIDSESY